VHRRVLKSPIAGRAAAFQVPSGWQCVQITSLDDKASSRSSLVRSEDGGHGRIDHGPGRNA
jgi:hypothetical protein